MTKRITLNIVIVHTVLAGLLIYPAFTPKAYGSESWSFFGAFFLDFPLSIAFHGTADSFGKIAAEIVGTEDKYALAKGWLTFCHLVLGAFWWLFLIRGGMRFYGLFSRSSTQT